MSTMTTPNPTTPESLLTLPEDVFRRLVDSDLRGKGDPQLGRLLRSREVVDRWYATIKGMTKSVEGQLAAKKADLEAVVLQIESDIAQAESRGDHLTASALLMSLKEQQQKDAKWRAGILRFKTGLEEVHAEARRIRDSYRGSFFDSYLAEERNFALERTRSLESAIRAHRDHECDIGCDNGCTADDDLWRLVS